MASHFRSNGAVKKSLLTPVSETPLGFYQQLYVVDVIFAVERKRQVYMYQPPDAGSIVAYSKAESNVCQ